MKLDVDFNIIKSCLLSTNYAGFLFCQAQYNFNSQKFASSPGMFR